MNAKIKLLVVIRHPVGGIRTYLKYTYRYLDQAKYHLTVLTAKEEEGELIKEDLGCFFDIVYISVKGKFILPKMVLKILKTLWDDHFDIIHSQGLTAGMVSILGNMFSRISHIITSHDVFRKDQFVSWRGVFKRSIMGVLLRQADVIQSVSYDAQQNLLDYLPTLQTDRKKMVVIENGVFVEKMPVDNSPTPGVVLREKAGIKGSRLMFGFLGRFMPQKGFNYLIDAVELLATDPYIADRFTIIAVNDGAYIREYKTDVAARGLSSYFVFYGFVPSVTDILKGLDALVVPSLWEAYGLIAAEAFVAGCPVIASDCIGLREVTQNTPAIIVKKEDSEGLAMALKALIATPAIYKEKAQEFIEEAKERFTSEKTGKALDILFSKLIASK